MMFSSWPFAGDEWCNFTAGVCGGVRRPVPDVWRLPPCGSQGLLEGRGSGSAEGEVPVRVQNLLVFTWNALKNCPAWRKPSGDSTERLKIRFTNAGIAFRDLFKFLHGHWHAVLIWQTLHKKTFYYLEQLILKHKLHQNSLNIKEIHGRSNFILSPACRQCASAEGGTGPLFLLGGPWSDPQWKVGPRLIRQQCN